MPKKKTPPPVSPAAPAASAATAAIQVRGARQNNLRGFDLDLALGQLHVVTGPSGSGKSSLAFDTIYAEGQRRYVETFSPYTRQFLDRMDRPRVDEIRSIPPAIAIEQSNPVKTTRSTVGTVTEINDYLKLLLPRLAVAHCPHCQREVRPETPRMICDALLSGGIGAPPMKTGGMGAPPIKPSGTTATAAVLITFSIPLPPKPDPADFFQFLSAQGYLRVWLDGTIVRTDEPPAKNLRLPPRVPVIQDRITLSPENHTRLLEALETALRLGSGKITVISPDGALHPFSTGWHCAHCDLDLAAPTPALFSFNNPLGACPACRGFGRTIAIDYDRAIPDRSLSLRQQAIKPFTGESGSGCQRDLLRCCAEREIDVDAPFADLADADQRWIIEGDDARLGPEELWKEGRWYGVRGFFAWMEMRAYKMHVRVLLSRYRAYTTCPACQGGRYQPATLNFRCAGKTLPELQVMPVGELTALLSPLAVADSTTAQLRSAVLSRLGYLVQAGLGYLSLDRPTRTLSGGELQRVNLTTCLGAALVNTLFVLDEPSIGLHPRDTARLIGVMHELRDRGNTLLVVEHDETVMRAADNLIELGPGRGQDGGDLVWSGPLSALADEAPARSLTAAYLTGRKTIPLPAQRRTPARWLTLEGAREHNLRDLTVRLPLGVFTCVAGVSGSGKSTLVHDVLYRALMRDKGQATDEPPGAFRRLRGAAQISEVIMVDQSPLARSPRSSPALYLGVFDGIRELFAKTPAALAEGMTASSFSFNSTIGRCPRCGGVGFERVEMQFLSDVFVRCPECEGRRYQPHILRIQLEGRSIHDVLELTVTEAIAFFQKLDAPHVAKPLQVLEDVGLGYLRLGHPLNVLSGGESQRLKLAERLSRRSTEGALLILDEPTTGLHTDDIAVLLRVFARLVEQGDSLLVIEHNIEVLKCADWIVELGPEAGADGGMLVAEGTPELLAASESSPTGAFLVGVLGGTSNIQHSTSNIQSRRRGAKANDNQEAINAAGRIAPPPGPLDVGCSMLNVGCSAPAAIAISGAREHNLKNLSLTIPRDQFAVITGLSGSGKSTLAFDILFAEGQRRFLDVLSPYARQFVEQLEKPEVDSITGLPPSVAIEQRITRGGGKSTVATVTEVYHFLRLLFSKTGCQFCPECDLPVESQTLAANTKNASALAKKSTQRLIAPLIRARKGFHTEVARWAKRQGFEELLVDGKWERVDAFPKLERFKEHTIEVLVARLDAKAKSAEIERAVKLALEIGKGAARLLDPRGKPTLLSSEQACPGCGLAFDPLDPRLFSFNSPHGWCEECHGFGEVWKAYVNPRLETAVEIELERERQSESLDDGEATTCPACEGDRLRPEARFVRLGARSISEVTSEPAEAALRWLKTLKFSGTEKTIAADILPEIEQRLKFLAHVGLDYLSLDRSARTLSGGESQRIRLAAQLGSNLRGVLYVLDEPTIGLHPRDNLRLLDTLEALRAKGNSLIVVEHDEETMRRADTILDLGPGAGIHGGHVVTQGTLDEILLNPASATARCLREPLVHPTRGERRPLDKSVRWLEVKGATLHNLRNADVRIPLGRLTVLTGVSGSGKSTFMRGVLRPAAEAAVAGKKAATKKLPLKKFIGGEHLEAVYEVDQSPIGKTSRSTPATYLGVFDEIRALFAQQPAARMRGYTASRFSFNTDGGRCETCAGQGVVKIEMAFLPTSHVPCVECAGRRYNPATLEVLHHGKSIGDVMQMSLAEAAAFFAPVPKIAGPLGLLCDTGLGYLQLGQPSPTLSGGEAQRLKLVSELTRGAMRSQTAKLRGRATGKTILYLLEEPTIGLHMADVRELLKVFHRLVDNGHTVVVIEHNTDLAADADYLVDIGPEAGTNGGQIVAAGTPEEVSKCKASRTAPFLRAALAHK